MNADGARSLTAIQKHYADAIEHAQLPPNLLDTLGAKIDQPPKWLQQHYDAARAAGRSDADIRAAIDAVLADEWRRDMGASHLSLESCLKAAPKIGAELAEQQQQRSVEDREKRERRRAVLLTEVLSSADCPLTPEQILEAEPDIDLTPDELRKWLERLANRVDPIYHGDSDVLRDGTAYIRRGKVKVAA